MNYEYIKIFFEITSNTFGKLKGILLEKKKTPVQLDV